MVAYQTTCERFVLQFGAFHVHDRDALHHINDTHICYQKGPPEMFEKWNYSSVSDVYALNSCANTTHSAYAISEYNEVYTNLICGTLNWKLGTARPLTDKVKPLRWC
jgi:hypothetical protein